MNLKNAVRIIKKDTLAKSKYVLKQVEFTLERSDGDIQQLKRDVFDRGNGAVVMLYNKPDNKIVLVNQFRIPTYFNGNESGMLLECPAGTLENTDPEARIKSEIEEETGYKVDDVQFIFKGYSSPGAVTEMLYYFTAPYSKETSRASGGGVKEEGEDIEVLEYDFKEAYDMISNGQIQDTKTILLLQYARLHIFK